MQPKQTVKTLLASAPTDGGLVKLWAFIRDNCPYPESNYRYWSWRFICKITLGWCVVVDRRHEITDPNGQAFYQTVVDAHCNMISASLSLIENLLRVSDKLPTQYPRSIVKGHKKRQKWKPYRVNKHS